MSDACCSRVMVGLLVLCLWGCHSDPHVAYFEVLSTRPATNMLQVESIWPTTSGTLDYLNVIDGKPEETRPRHQVSTTRFGAQWKSEQPDRREVFLAFDDEGNITMNAVIERIDDALSLFVPPLIAMPKRLEPGQTYSRTVAMRVVQAKNERHERHRGRATQRFTYREDCRIRIGTREYDVARIELTFIAILTNWIKVEQNTFLYILPDRGLVAEDSQRSTTVLGIPIKSLIELQVIAPDSMSDP